MPDENGKRRGSDGRTAKACVCSTLLSRKWTPQIVSVLLAEPRRYSELRDSISGLSDKVLAQRLGELEETGILTHAHCPQIPPRVEYTLTPAGMALRRVVVEMERWTRTYGAVAPPR